MFNDYQKLKTILVFPLTQLKHYIKKKIFRYFTDVSLPFWLLVCIKKTNNRLAFFLKKDFFDMDHFTSLYCICYNEIFIEFVASVAFMF